MTKCAIRASAAALLIAAGALAVDSAAAQQYPTRPVRLIVPFVAGVARVCRGRWSGKSWGFG